MIRILINGIKTGLEDDEAAAIVFAKRYLKRNRINAADFDFSIYKRSIDARDKNHILFVYSVLAETKLNIDIKSIPHIKVLGAENLQIEYGEAPLVNRPLVVGMGPAGMFCALLLAENGYSPIIIDRGDSVADRSRALEQFILTGKLDTESNVQFGAGGAGTFSDGKLTTRINDVRCDYVLSRFVEFGAPDEIMIKSKPHIGTDVLISVVDNILKRIEELGGSVIYRCRMDDISVKSDSVTVHTTKGDFSTSALVLALGHSSRDTYRMLLSHNFVIEPKPFSIGVRVEHLQEDINVALYGKNAGHPKLSVGEYNLSDTNGKRGVYTFCMCPGGEVVPATSQELGVCVNGMSKFARDGKNANCAVNVSVNTDDYGNTPQRAIEFQEMLERRAYQAGGGDYYAPIQLMGDFLENKVSASPSRIMPTYANGNRVTVTNLNDILPIFVSARLQEGFRIFDKKLKGFAVDDAVLTGIETRTSAPLRIMRNENLSAISNPLIYPCGEGAGYAGGIMSSAVDGIKVALEIMKKYKV
ncbi:MAG: hypothetical protein IKA84_02555 [Clostridia bacterium]|nr:hypothetical protein [Clostridia bacterium]